MFSAFSRTEELDEVVESERRASLDDRMEKLEGVGETTRKRGDVPVPVCALASYGAQPLISAGLCHGAVHILFVKEVRSVLVETAI